MAGQDRVELDGGHRLDLLEERQREGAEARTDLQHHVGRVEIGSADDPPHRVGVDDEVLATLLGRSDVVAGRQRTDIRRPEKSRTGGCRWVRVHSVEPKDSGLLVGDESGALCRW